MCSYLYAVFKYRPIVAFIFRTKKHGTSKEIPCPLPTVMYNKFMNDVDPSNQNRMKYVTVWWPIAINPKKKYFDLISAFCHFLYIYFLKDKKILDFFF